MIFRSKPLCFAMLVCCLLFAIGLISIPLRQNRHTVIEKQVYRSAQLDSTSLAYLIERNGIRSILNLRGAWPSNDWYQIERKTAAMHHVKLYNLNLDARRLPALKELKCLQKIIDAAPKPLLIHCKRGADRTGFAASVALLLHGETQADVILSQSSWPYLSTAKDSVGRQVLSRYQHWLQQHHLKMERNTFLQWLSSLSRGSNYPYFDGETPENYQHENAQDDSFCDAILTSTG